MMKTPSDIDKIIIEEALAEPDVWKLFAAMCHILLLTSIKLSSRKL